MTCPHVAVWGAIGVTMLLAGTAAAQSGHDCNRTSVGFTPLSDLGAGTYQGFEGGLYPGGVNTVPQQHLAAGRGLAEQVVPRDGAGNPSPAGSIVLITIGMSNTRSESAAWLPMVGAFPNVNPRLRVLNTAQGGQHAGIIQNPQAPYWTFVNQTIAQAGLTPAQVQAVWLKEAVAGPTLPFPADAQQLQGYLGDIVRNIHDKFPNARLCFISSRIYAGYALGTLNPEPYAYQSGFSVKWLIEDQIGGAPTLNFRPAAGPVEAPWLGWGAYPWADGLTPRSDGLIWRCEDFQDDGTHPNQQGTAKVAGLLMQFFARDAATRPWFVACEADVNNDGSLDLADFGAFQTAIAVGQMSADCNDDGALNLADFGCFQTKFALGCP